MHISTAVSQSSSDTNYINLPDCSQHQNDDLLGQVLYFYTFYACMQKATMYQYDRQIKQQQPDV